MVHLRCIASGPSRGSYPLPQLLPLAGARSGWARKLFLRPFGAGPPSYPVGNAPPPAPIAPPRAGSRTEGARRAAPPGCARRGARGSVVEIREVSESGRRLDAARPRVLIGLGRHKKHSDKRCGWDRPPTFTLLPDLGRSRCGRVTCSGGLCASPSEDDVDTETLGRIGERVKPN